MGSRSRAAQYILRMKEWIPGPILMQRAVEVQEGDTEDTLSVRILEQEHEFTARDSANAGKNSPRGAVNGPASDLRALDSQPIGHR